MSIAKLNKTEINSISDFKKVWMDTPSFSFNQTLNITPPKANFKTLLFSKKVFKNAKVYTPLLTNKPIYFFKVFEKNHKFIDTQTSKNIKFNKLKTKPDFIRQHNFFKFLVNFKQNHLKQIFVESNIERSFVQIFDTFFLLEMSQEYLLRQVISNVKNIPWSSVVIFLNKARRLWKVFKMFFYKFIISFTFLKSNLLLKLFNQSILKSKKLKYNLNFRKLKIWNLKSVFFKITSINLSIFIILKKQINSFMKINQINNILFKSLYFWLRRLKLFQKFFKILKTKKKILQKYIKLQLWKNVIKVHNQKSINWVFKKYWIKIIVFKKFKFSKKLKLKNILKSSYLLFFKNNFKNMKFFNKKKISSLLYTYYII